ncbi:hypothetical protein [Anabaena sp. UHCC 0451]|uniref:hypothetical protein n=1 Tax=Anabaena sp. UHCC 0451 TaxID=2055235 RepID=UPI002B218FBF|nr:hypothetical protein [Anabaena sp. UHCC 0451]MEA5578728.1 hypothetical protein [Anabaena sp. UHCC 0451]
MKKIRSTLSLIGIAIAPLSFPLEANAIPYKGDNVYMATGGNGGLVVTNNGMGSTPSAVVSVLTRRTSARVRGSCGEVRISASSLGANPPTSIKINDATIDISALPVVSTQCQQGSFSMPAPGTFKTPSGDVINYDSSFVGQAAKIEYMAQAFRNVTFNACGFGVVRFSETVDFPATIAVNGTNYTKSALKVAAGAPICSSNTPYAPANTSWLAP